MLVCCKEVVDNPVDNWLKSVGITLCITSGLSTLQVHTLKIVDINRVMQKIIVIFPQFLMGKRYKLINFAYITTIVDKRLRD